MTKGNNWFYVEASGSQRLDFFYSCANTIIRNGRTYYVMQHFIRETGKITCPDTLCTDTLGNVWRYGAQHDTLWFDFSKDTTAGYTYGKFSVQKGLADTIITPSGTYKHCVCFTFIDSVNNGYRFIFKDSIGMIVHTRFFWGTTGTARLKSAEVNDTIIGIHTNANDYFPLQKGNIWVYYTVRFSPDTLVYEIVDTTTIDGKIYYRLTISPVFEKNRAEYLLRKDTLTGNVYKRAGQQDVLFNTVNLSLLECEPYFYKSSLSDSAIESWLEATHTVPAGKFNFCRYYKMDNLPEAVDDEFYYVYAPGVGLIADHNDGSIPNYSKLIYAIIDGKQIGQVVEIKTAYKPVLKPEKTFETFLLINGYNLLRFHQYNQESTIFTVNGRAVGNSNVSRIKAAKLSRGCYIFKTKK